MWHAPPLAMSSESSCADAALSASAWLKGDNGERDLLQVTASGVARATTRSEPPTSKQANVDAPTVDPAEGSSVPAIAPAQPIASPSISRTTQAHRPPSSTTVATPPQAATAPAPSPSKPQPSLRPITVTATQQGTPIRWSRSFLLGKTALKPDYDGVSGLDPTAPAELQLLKANTRWLTWPLADAGGRIGVHPVAQKGRLPTHVPSLVCGAAIVDFALDPFDENVLHVACVDGRVRIFRLPTSGSLETDLDSPEAVLSGASASLRPD